MSRNVAAAPAHHPSPDKGQAGLAPARTRAARLAGADAAPVPSAVHALQDMVAQRLDVTAAGRWSPRATASFVLLVCGAFWVAVLLAARLLMG